MSESEIKSQYKSYRLPSWAPPSQAFGIVWPVLYALMTISFGYIFWLKFHSVVSDAFVIPFAVNLFLNGIYIYLQFKTSFKWLAAADILLIILSLMQIMMQTLGTDLAWVGWVNVPYLLWVIYALVLQVWINLNN